MTVSGSRGRQVASAQAAKSAVKPSSVASIVGEAVPGRLTWPSFEGAGG